MIFLRLDALPDPDRDRDPEVADCIGAVVIAWVDTFDADEAESVVRSHVAEEGWIPGDVSELYGVLRRDVEEDEVARQLFDDAESNGAVVEIHAYLGDED